MKLTATSFSTTLEGMEVSLSPKQQQQLSQLATKQGREPKALAQEAIDLYLEEEIRYHTSIKLAQESFERGEYLTHEQVGARLKQLFKS